VLQKDRRLVAVVVPDLGEVRKREDGDVEKAVREAVEEGTKKGRRECPPTSASPTYPYRAELDEILKDQPA
jgi:hypothetical protein